MTNGMFAASEVQMPHSNSETQLRGGQKTGARETAAAGDGRVKKSKRRKMLFFFFSSIPLLSPPRRIVR